MKKPIFLAILVLAYAIPSLSFASIDFNMKYGARGTEVTELQEFLISKSFLTGSATGNFYSLTRKAVMDYQTAENLPSTGFVGPMTRQKINAELAVDDSAEIAETGSTTTPTVSVSPDTVALQKKIDDLVKAMTDMQVQQKAQTDQTNAILGGIQQNTTPVITQSSPFGNVSVTVDKSGMTAKVTRGPFNYDAEIRPYGEFFIEVSVLDSKGNYAPGVTVNMQANDPTDNAKIKGTPDENRDTSPLSGSNQTSSVTFGYDPTNWGAKTLAFTANGMTKTIDVTVPFKPNVTEYKNKILSLTSQIMTANRNLATLEQNMRNDLTASANSPEQIAGIINSSFTDERQQVKSLQAQRTQVEQDFANSVPFVQ